MKLSVITITYGDPDGLANTLHSLVPLLSTTLSWEHLVVDSSPEVNEKILSSISPSWPLRVIKTPPEGIYAAMNSGVEAAKGDILWFLNGGDKLINSAAMERLVIELCSSPDIDMICGASDLVKGKEYLYPKLPRANFLQSILYRNQLSHQAVLYKKEIFERVGPFSRQYRIAADYEHYFRCFLAGTRVKCVDDRLVTCDLTGLSSVKWEASLREAQSISKNLRDQLPKSVYLRHQFFCRLEYLRVWVIKFLQKNLGHTKLKAAWIWWNR